MTLDRSTFNTLLGSMSELMEREAQKRSREAERASKPTMLVAATWLITTWTGLANAQEAEANERAMLAAMLFMW